MIFSKSTSSCFYFRSASWNVFWLAKIFVSLARISCFIVWFFLFCHVWKLIPTAFEAGSSQDGLFHQDWPTWVLVVENLSHLLITINSTVNFLIYVIIWAKWLINAAFIVGFFGFFDNFAPNKRLVLKTESTHGWKRNKIDKKGVKVIKKGWYFPTLNISTFSI